YDGSQDVTQGVGSFKVTVTSGAAPNIKIVTAVGFVPNATHPVAIKKIITQVTRLKWIDPVCGVCAGGEQPPGDSTPVKVGGTASINASQSPRGRWRGGAYCSGVTPQAAVASTGTVTTNGTPNLYAPPGGVAQENSATFPSGMLLSNTDTATLKAMAKAQGTYYKGVPPWNGGVPPKNGIIFVDNTDGSVLTRSTPADNIPSITIHGKGTYRGYHFVGVSY